MRFAFGEDETRRIARAVRAVEQGQGGSDLAASGPRHVGAHLSVVKVSVVASPYASGFRLDFDAEAGNLLQLDAVKIRDVGGASLKANAYYLGFFSGYHLGIPVFLVSGSGGSTTTSGSGSGGGDGSGGSTGECVDVIQSISCDDGELTVTYATICPDAGTAIIVGQQQGEDVATLQTQLAAALALIATLEARLTAGGL